MKVGNYGFSFLSFLNPTRRPKSYFLLAYYKETAQCVNLQFLSHLKWAIYIFMKLTKVLP
jgi:hypothetical protein